MEPKKLLEEIKQIQEDFDNSGNLDDLALELAYFHNNFKGLSKASIYSNRDEVAKFIEIYRSLAKGAQKQLTNLGVPSNPYDWLNLLNVRLF